MDLQRIESQRDLVYRRTRTRRIRTLEQAARFIDTVGFCLLFASKQGIELPSLFEAMKGRRDARIDDWDADADRLWVWKNDLPAIKRAYYGKAIKGKPIFISLRLLPFWMAVAMPADVNQAYARGQLSMTAKRVYDALRERGPTPTMALRIAAGLERRESVERYHRALDELQHTLLILPVGATVERGAWPSQIFELTTRWFPRQAARAATLDLTQARRALVRRYIETVIAATPAMIARLFDWSPEIIDATLRDLIERRHIIRQGEWILRNG